MTDITKLQSAFEEWMASSNYPQTAEIALEKLEDGNYRSQLTFAAWQGWQGGARLASGEIDRLRRMLKHIADQDYDAGYSAEDFARHAMDPQFDEGDVGAVT